LHPNSRETRRAPRLPAIGVVMLLAGASCGTPHIYSAPDYRRTVWVRVGITSERHPSFGLAFDDEPATVGIEASPGSALGVVRAFAGLKDGLRWEPLCRLWGRLGGGAVAAFGPRQPFHLGLRLGAYVEDSPVAEYGPVAFPAMTEGASYLFSWFPGAGHLHDVGAAVGTYWAPHGACGND
jgi:hypothetical protein